MGEIYNSVNNKKRSKEHQKTCVVHQESMQPLSLLAVDVQPIGQCDSDLLMTAILKYAATMENTIIIHLETLYQQKRKTATVIFIQKARATMLDKIKLSEVLIIIQIPSAPLCTLENM